MHYAPHTLYKRHECPIKLDELGKPVPSSDCEWVKIGVCRCDDNSTQQLTSPNGQLYKSRYHVVYDRSNEIEEGDAVRCVNADGSIRGEGTVGMVKSTNYLNFSELWM